MTTQHIYTACRHLTIAAAAEKPSAEASAVGSMLPAEMCLPSFSYRVFSMTDKMAMVAGEGEWEAETRLWVDELLLQRLAATHSGKASRGRR